MLLRFAEEPAVGGGARPPRRKGAACRFSVLDIDNAEAAKLYERRLVLVRPDGHVAWRADAMPAEIPDGSSIRFAARNAGR